MKYILFAATLCLCACICQAQKISFFQKLKVGISNGADSNYRPRLIDAKKDVVKKHTSETYSPAGALLSYQETETPDWSKSKPLRKDSVALPSKIKEKEILYADIKPEEGRLMVYFWPFSGTGAEVEQVNAFYKDNLFSIALPERINLSFNSSAFHAGVLSLPIKAFIGGPDSVSAVQSAVSVGVYAGKRWGKTKFVKLPNEKETTTYQSSWSLNVVAGINKLDLDEKNTKDAGKAFKGSVTSLSTGLAGGWHYKTFSVFVALGLDHPLSKKAKQWSLKGKPWIGFGAGFEIF